MYSFDVFDTLITRTTATPKGIFALMQDTLLKDNTYFNMSEYIKNNFYELRINSEAHARFNYSKDNHDIVLEQIYLALAMTGNLSQADITALIELEKKTEYENVVAIEENINMVKGLVNKGEQVILISDMYLDSSTIKKMLIKVDCIFKDIPLYVSCENSATKFDGTLYNLIKIKENINNEQWVHYGDNDIADVKSAASYNIGANLFKYECLMPCELALLKSNESNSLIQLTVGASKNARLKYKLTGNAAIGATIGGGILFPYVWWILNECKEKGIKRLYFVARDGYVTRKIADIIIQKMNFDIETHYIYGSRKAWRIPSLSINDSFYKFILQSFSYLITSIDLLAELFEVPLHDILKFVPENYKGKHLSQHELLAMVKELDNNKEFKSFIVNSHFKKRELVVDYLKQELNTNDDNFAFVELAGTGYTQECLSKIISNFYHKPIKSFFFKLDKIKDNKQCLFFNFLPNNIYLNYIIELLCRAPHGQTIGYIKENNRILPNNQRDEGNSLIQYEYNDYIKGIELFTEQYIKIIANKSITMRNTLLLEYFNYMIKTPDKQLLNFLGDMPFGSTGNEKSTVKFAPILSRNDILQLYLLNNNERENTFYLGSCLDYSLLRCSGKDKKLIEFYIRNNQKLLGKCMRFFYKINNKNTINNSKYNFPYDMLQKRIVIYGAGKVGQSLYNSIKQQKKCKIVKWVDKNYKEYSKSGFKVSPLEQIIKVDYDQIIIAILNKSVADEITTSLINMGVPKEKILWVDLNLRWE